MKYSIAVALFAVLCAALVRAQEEVCHSKVEKVCQPSSRFSGKNVNCNARYGGINALEPEIQAYINLHLTKSYEYLLMATSFNSFQKDRPGFEKLYRALSDRSFEDSINLIKQVTRRGGRVTLFLSNFNPKHKVLTSAVPLEQVVMERRELQSLAKALDNEKHLAKGAIHVHTKAARDHTMRDPEMSQYIKEKFLTSQAESIRKLSGYVNDLSKIMDHADPSLGVHLFDKYLQKQ